VKPPAPTNNSRPEPPKNVTVPPAPAKNETKPVTPPTPVQPPKNTTGPTPQPPAKPATNTTNSSAPVPPKPAAPANTTTNSTKKTTDNKAPAKKAVDYTAYHKLAREEAKREWKSLTRKTDNNGDGKISFNEILLNYARENGIYID